MISITFLGTGTSQGIPIIGNDHPVCLSSDVKDKRLRSSISVEWNSARFIVDCGPDFRMQLLQNKIDAINGILFTHEHADHTAGLDDIRPLYFKQGEIELYAEKRVIESLKKRFHYFFVKEKYPGIPSVHFNEIQHPKPLQLSELEVIPIRVMHGKLEILGYRFSNFVYITDLKTLPKEELNKLKNVDVLVINCLRKEPHFSHLNLEEALDLVNLIKPNQSYFTHISHLLGFHNEIEKTLPHNVHLAYDNLNIHSS